jgi:inner membrane protein
MDTLTQITLGAAVGYAVLGRRVGRKALVWGGVCGLLPDLDVLVPMGDAVRDFTYHRGASHSLFVLAALTPLVAWLITRIHKDTAVHRRWWYALVYGAFATHVLLDCFTVYGTQIFWPVKTPPVMWSTIFIIDPVYTLPLLLGVAAAWILARRPDRGRLINTLGILLSSLYLAWSVGAKLHVNQVARGALNTQGIEYTRMLTLAAPFNTVLWRVLAMTDRGYVEGYYSLLDQDKTVRFTPYPSDPALLEGIEDHWPVKRLQWFTHGFYALKKEGSAIVMSDLRMGLEPSYVFQFKVAEAANPHPRPVAAERFRSPRSLNTLGWVWRRIYNENT